MIVFFQCVAEAVTEKGLRGLIDMIPGGAFAYDVAQSALEKYRQRCKDDQIRAEVQELANAKFEAVQQAAADAARQAAGGSREEVQDLELFLTGIPAAVKQSLKRPEDPTGTTVSPRFALRSPDDLLKLLPPRPPRSRPGDELFGKPSWLLEQLLGIGGFGEVWLARNRQIPSLVGAVKFCHGLHASDRQLLHESRVIQRVMEQGQHPNIVPLLDAHLDGDPPWLMYEYVAGGDLADLVRAWQALPPPERLARAVAALLELSQAVSHFHRLTPAVVHRDLKPANILRDARTNVLRVTDFGIGAVTAKTALADEARGTTTRGGRLLSNLRGTYTPIYSSPQQRDGADPDPRDDVHALGVIGYQLLTGHLNQGAGPDFATDLEEAGCSGALIAVLGRCVAQKADRRPAHAEAVRAALVGLSLSVPRTPEPPSDAEQRRKNLERQEVERQNEEVARRERAEAERKVAETREAAERVALEEKRRLEAERQRQERQRQTQQQAPSPPLPPTPGQRNEVKVTSHAQLFYSWPIWTLALLLALLPWWGGKRSAAERPENPSANANPQGTHPQPKFAPRLAASSGPGFLFLTVVVVVLTATCVPLRGLWSFLLLVVMAALAVLAALLGWWESVATALPWLAIQITPGGYLVLAGGLFVAWLITLLWFDRQFSVTFQPGQVRVETERGIRLYDSSGVKVETQSADVFRHYLLGFGSADVVVRTGGASGDQFDLPNVLFAGRKRQLIQELYARRSGKPTEVVVRPHSRLFFCWPIWALGFLLAFFTWASGDVQAEASIDLTGGPTVPIAQTSTPGSAFVLVFLVVLVVLHVPVRGAWPLVLFPLVGLLGIVASGLGWFAALGQAIPWLDVRISVGGYLFLGLGLFAAWLVTLLVVDREAYIHFYPGQFKVQCEIGGGERVYDTWGLSCQRSREELFLHFLLGFGSGDLRVKTSGAGQVEFTLPNVLLIHSKLGQIEDVLRQRRPGW